ncbi:ankyrin repeat domain-containing protein [Nannocystis bainbridge]|uniref:Ankyrin repeat domain-containing protein n=1 Tax=Nannocystis bainbridge TaxID=2995303 RepID=A0ABT5E8D4_9BACT|nr:ankyrin repeat domain-containing protein [Nannocystis bainbridge]MDC0721599.1 ankyrin repeat domain-containing protein [Nannocystis bainbridge]
MLSSELVAAVEGGDIEAIEQALRAEPGLIAARTGDEDTLLHLACWQKQTAIAALLLARGADPNARGCYGRTALHYAVHDGRAVSVELVRSLLARGADPWIAENNGFTAEAWARQEMWDEPLAAVLQMFAASRSRAPG